MLVSAHLILLITILVELVREEYPTCYPNSFSLIEDKLNEVKTKSEYGQ